MEREKGKRPPLDNLDVSIALDSNHTPLSTYIASKSAEVTYR